MTTAARPAWCLSPLHDHSDPRKSLAAAREDALMRSPTWKAAEAAALVQLRHRGIPEYRMPLRASEGFGYWAGWLARRPERSLDAVVLVTGQVGFGKSTLALRMALAIDPRWSTRNLCYSARALLDAYARVRPGEVVVYDEGVRGLLAGDQSATEQKALIQALALIRERRAILFICAPSIWNIAKQVRQNRATLWLEVVARGQAIVFARSYTLRFTPDSTLGFERASYAPRLTWEPFANSARVWKAYKAEKDVQLQDYLEETSAMLGRKDKDRDKAGQPPAARPPGSPGDAPAAADAERRRRHAAVVARSRARAAERAAAPPGGPSIASEAVP